jgi:pimeloyl-ACP methyl ester carboxylesterase
VARAAALAHDYRFEVLDGAGHFLPEEAPARVTELLLEWLEGPLSRAGRA